MILGSHSSSGFNAQTRLLARFASTLNYNELPQEVVDHTKICVLDALGSIFLGSTPTTVIEGEWGYLKAFSDKAPPSWLTEKLGQSYSIMETTFKPYLCCKALHAAIDGILELNREYRFDPEQVMEVVIGGYEKLVKIHDIYEPFTSMAAQFSIPYFVCVALLKGSLGIGAFSDIPRERRITL